MKKNKIQKIIHSKGYVSIETLIVAGLIIATGAFLVSKLVWKGKDVAISSNNNMSTIGKTMDDNSFNNGSIGESTIPGGGGATNSVVSPKDIDCSLVENPSDLSDYEYQIIDDDYINSVVKKYNDDNYYMSPDELKKWEESFRGIYKNLKGDIIITKYRGNNKDLKIPSCIDGKKVSSIGSSAFQANNLTSITIPDSVTEIGSSAFQTNNLTSVKIPNSVTHIGDCAFFHNNLTSITIPDSVTEIGAGAFSDNKLTSVTIPNSVTKIIYGTFDENNLTSVTIPNSVTEIGASAFYHNKLTSVTIPNSVTKIGLSSFQSNNLTSVTIPDSVTEIGLNAFHHNQLTSVTIPNSVTEIGAGAFSDNKLTSVTIPKKFDTEKDKYFNDYYSPNEVLNIKFNLI
ncbi:leucine-rich repeat domain-containing protein [Clostridium perfringens]|uniref:leucine-rich repeat domain-containing protein n=1 Tax=Clostridium perfringens TaxID=1502 RepID=UPI001A9BA4CE|nr:leucine-rich repeat domain-containing protein [Clostridium perfringens]